MLRAILSFCSIFFLGTLGVLFGSVYYNFSMAQLEIPTGRPIKVDWKLPRVAVVLEYNERSVAEDFAPDPEPVALARIEEEEEEEHIEEFYHEPDILEMGKVAAGDDISSDELVGHYGFPALGLEEIAAFSLKNYIDSIHLDKMLASFDEKNSLKEGKTRDLVSMGKSSNKKNDNSNEMIFIDYSKPTERKVPPKPEPVALLAKAAPPFLPKSPMSISIGSGEKPKASGFSSMPPLLSLAHNFVKDKFFRRTLRARSTAEGKYLDFQFIPDYDDKGEAFSSDEKGVVEIFPGKRLESGVLRGRLVSPGHIRTVVNLPIEERKEVDFDIPLIDEGTFEQYGDSDTNFDGGFLLVWISKKAEDVDIDSEYSLRIFLDEEFREVSHEDEYSYVLFMGIQPRITNLSYLLENGEVAEKPVHISANEILYDFSSIGEAGYETFELYQKNLFSGKRVELPLGEREISYFNRDISPTRKGLNYYDIKRPALPAGSRNYLKLEHLDGTLYVGYKKEHRLEIPGQDFIENIMDGFGIDDLSNSCLIQLNFSDPIIHFGAGLDSFQWHDGIDLVYLNSDGTFEEMPSLKTEKAFILGESAGVLAGAAEYSDGRREFFKSFCSPGSYLIEQL